MTQRPESGHHLQMGVLRSRRKKKEKMPTLPPPPEGSGSGTLQL
jgi:hypothetical protein